MDQSGERNFEEFLRTEYNFLTNSMIENEQIGERK